MQDPVELFLRIIDLVSDGRLRLTRDSKIGDLFQDLLIFSPLDYELSLYSLEATLCRKINDSFYEGGAEKDLDTTIEDFIRQYLDRTVPDDLLFIARQFKKFAKSAQWDGEERAEPGKN